MLFARSLLHPSDSTKRIITDLGFGSTQMAVRKASM